LTKAASASQSTYFREVLEPDKRLRSWIRQVDTATFKRAVWMSASSNTYRKRSRVIATAEAILHPSLVPATYAPRSRRYLLVVEKNTDEKYRSTKSLVAVAAAVADSASR
jgi:hypothetical protein